MFKVINNIFVKPQNNIQKNLSSHENWSCKGGFKGQPPHQIREMSYDDKKCTYCGADRDDQPEIKRNEHKENTRKKSDPILFNTLTCLNIGSAWTTMQGANQILPIIGYPIGAIIQLMLFLLVSGSAGKKLPKNTKWIAIGVFSVLSIYTSFFGFYSGIGVSNDKNKELLRAKEAHATLISDLYTPLKLKVDNLSASISDKRNQLEDEDKSNGVTGKPGKGDNWKKLNQERIALETEYKLSDEILKNLAPVFIYNTDKQSSAREILDLDIKALSKIPPEWLETNIPAWLKKVPSHRLERYRNKDLFKVNYMDPDNEFEVLAPFNKIIKGEPRAILAGLLAIMLDGTIIMLGAAIDYRKRKEVKVPSKRKGSEIIDDIRQSIKDGQIEVVGEELKKECIYLFDTMKSCGWLTLHYVKKELEQISTSTNTETSSFPKVEPLYIEQEFWKIIPNKEKKLFNWLESERSRHINKKAISQKPKDGYQTFLFPCNEDE